MREAVKRLEKILKSYVIVAGDFNLTMDAIKNRTKISKEERRNKDIILKILISKIDLKDVWKEIKSKEVFLLFTQDILKN